MTPTTPIIPTTETRARVRTGPGPAPAPDHAHAGTGAGAGRCPPRSHSRFGGDPSAADRRRQGRVVRLRAVRVGDGEGGDGLVQLLVLAAVPGYQARVDAVAVGA